MKKIASVAGWMAALMVACCPCTAEMSVQDGHVYGQKEIDGKRIVYDFDVPEEVESVKHGVGCDDTDEDIEYLAGKLVRLRIFDDEAGVMNLDVVQTGGEILVVSQFTLQASTRKGNRPSYIKAAPEAISRPLYERFAAGVGRALGREVATGEFGADMQVELVNDGPVTIWMDSKNKE